MGSEISLPLTLAERRFPPLPQGYAETMALTSTPHAARHTDEKKLALVQKKAERGAKRQWSPLHPRSCYPVQAQGTTPTRSLTHRPNSKPSPEALVTAQVAVKPTRSYLAPPRRSNAFRMKAGPESAVPGVEDGEESDDDDGFGSDSSSDTDDGCVAHLETAGLVQITRVRASCVDHKGTRGKAVHAAADGLAVVFASIHSMQAASPKKDQKLRRPARTCVSILRTDSQRHGCPDPVVAAAARHLEAARDFVTEARRKQNLSRTQKLAVPGRVQGLARPSDDDGLCRKLTVRGRPRRDSYAAARVHATLARRLAVNSSVVPFAATDKGSPLRQIACAATHPGLTVDEREA